MSEETEVEEGGSSKVFLILGLLLGVGLGGGAGYYFSGNKEAPAADQQVAEKKQEPAKELISVPFERLAVPVYSQRGNRRRFVGNYFINANVLVDGEENQIAVKRMLAQLQHGFISSISKTDLMKEGSTTELDLDKVARIFERKAVEIMGSGVVEKVAITEAIMMPR